MQLSEPLAQLREPRRLLRRTLRGHPLSHLEHAVHHRLVAHLLGPGHVAGELRVGGYDVLLSDLMMPGTDGIQLFRQALEVDPLLVGVIMTGQGTIQTAVEAMKAGAFDYVLKPFRMQNVLPVLDRAMEVRRLRVENLRLRQYVKSLVYESDRYRIVGSSAAVIKVVSMIKKVAPTGATVLVRGPDARFSTIAVSTEPVTDLDVRDDGYAVAQVGRRVRVLAPGVTDVTAGRAVTVDPGCAASAPAWDGNNVVGWEGCPSGWVLDHWTADGARVSRSAVVPGMSRPLHTAVAAGQLLVALEDHRITRVSVARRVDVPNALRWGQPDW